MLSKPVGGSGSPEEAPVPAYDLVPAPRTPAPMHTLIGCEMPTRHPSTNERPPQLVLKPRTCPVSLALQQPLGIQDQGYMVWCLGLRDEG